MLTTSADLTALVRRLPDDLKPLFGFLFLKNTDIIRMLLEGKDLAAHPAVAGKPEADALCLFVGIALEAADDIARVCPELDRRTVLWEDMTQAMGDMRRAVQTEGLDDLNTLLVTLSAAIRLLVGKPRDVLIGDIMSALFKAGAEGARASLLATAFNDLRAYLSENYGLPSMPPVTLMLPGRIARVRNLTPQLRKAGKRAETAFSAVLNLLLMQADIILTHVPAPLERILSGQGVSAEQAAFVAAQLSECRLAVSILPKNYGHLASALATPGTVRALETDMRSLFAADKASPARDMLTVLVETLAVLMHEDPAYLPEAITKNRLAGEPGTTYAAHSALAVVRLLSRRESAA